MSTAEMMARIEGTSPRLRTKFVGAYYLLTISTGAFVLLFHGRFAFAADLLASGFYFAMTAFLYALSRPGSNQKER